jgi:hypothetical protein
MICTIYNGFKTATNLKKGLHITLFVISLISIYTLSSNIFATFDCIISFSNKTNNMKTKKILISLLSVQSLFAQEISLVRRANGSRDVASSNYSYIKKGWKSSHGQS